MILKEDSFARLQALALTDPSIDLILSRALVTTYDEFIDVLYRDIDKAVQKAQERKQIYHNATEDVITMYLVDLLEDKGYIATHDTKMGGHIDLVVRGKDPSFLWLGEAKRDGGAEWIGKGFEQLCSRYSNGGNNQRHGGILVYIQGRNAASIFQNWRSHLPTMTQFEGLTLTDCPRTPETAFVSEHLHETTGLPYKVRHISMALYHQPTV